MSRDDLFAEYLQWCEQEELAPSRRYSRSKFSERLKAAYPAVKDHRPRLGSSRPRLFLGITTRGVVNDLSWTGPE